MNKIQIITATSWNATEHYYDWEHKRFVSFENADLNLECFHCSAANMDSAKEQAEQDNLKDVKLENCKPYEA